MLISNFINEIKKNISDTIFLTVNLGICIAVSILFLLNINIQTSLSGVTVNADKPALNINNIMSGKYQSDFERYFTQNFPLRSYFVKGYNQIKYYLGDEVNNLCVGKDGELYISTMLDSLVYYKIDDNTLNEYKSSLEAVKAALDRKNTKFLYVISSNKAEVDIENIPFNYKLALKSVKELHPFRNQILKTVNDLGIDYLDTTQYIIDSKNNEYLPYSKTGAHWNEYGTGIAINAYINKIREMGYGINPVDISYSKLNAPVAPQDTDYKELLNVYYSKIDKEYPGLKFTAEKSEDNINIYSIATSYQNRILELFKGYGMPFNKWKRLYYNQNQTLIQWEQGKVAGEIFAPPVEFDKIDFSEIFEYDIFILEHVGYELPLAHIDFMKRFAQYIKDNNL